MKDNGIPPDALDSGKQKVLVVDDDPEIVELFVDVLERDGRFEVKTASTGYDAGILTQEFMPDLVILDYMLPDINGNVVCQTIRKNPEFRAHEDHHRLRRGEPGRDQRPAQERGGRVREKAVQHRKVDRADRGIACGLNLSGLDGEPDIYSGEQLARACRSAT